MTAPSDAAPPTSLVYREIADACGVDVARLLHEHYAGAALKPPLKAAPDHPLALRIGIDAAARLCAAFGGEQIEVPVHWRCYRELAREACERLARGDRVNDVARELRVTRRFVQRVRKKGLAPKKNSAPHWRARQMSLF